MIRMELSGDGVTSIEKIDSLPEPKALSIDRYCMVTYKISV